MSSALAAHTVCAAGACLHGGQLAEGFECSVCVANARQAESSGLELAAADMAQAATALVSLEHEIVELTSQGVSTTIPPSTEWPTGWPAGWLAGWLAFALCGCWHQAAGKHATVCRRTLTS